MKTINLEEIQRKYSHGFSEEQWAELKDSFPYPDMRAAMKEACRQTLELAAENAFVEYEFPKLANDNGVNKQSILDTIKQVV